MRISGTDSTNGDYKNLGDVIISYKGKDIGVIEGGRIKYNSIRYKLFNFSQSKKQGIDVVRSMLTPSMKSAHYDKFEAKWASNNIDPLLLEVSVQLFREHNPIILGEKIKIDSEIYLKTIAEKLRTPDYQLLFTRYKINELTTEIRKNLINLESIKSSMDEFLKHSKTLLSSEQQEKDVLTPEARNKFLKIIIAIYGQNKKINLEIIKAGVLYSNEKIGKYDIKDFVEKLFKLEDYIKKENIIYVDHNLMKKMNKILSIEPEMIDAYLSSRQGILINYGV